MCVQAEARERRLLGLCSVMCLPCFLHCNSQTHKVVSQDAAAHFAAQSDSGPMMWEFAPSTLLPFSWLWVVLTIPLLPDFSACARLRERTHLYFSSSIPISIILKNQFACHFLFLVEKKPQPWTWQPLNLSTTASYPQHNVGEARHMQAGMAVHQNMILMCKS